MKNILLFQILNFLLLFSNSKKLISIYSINRHGARGPMSINLDSKNFFGNLILNKGKLTSYGERMLFILGLYKRNKYLNNNNNNFLNKKCDSNELYFVSTNLDRTIMSTLSQIFGFCYNSFNDKNINENLVNFTYPPINIFENEKMKHEISLLNKEKFSLPFNINLLPYHISKENEGKFLITMSKKCRKEYEKILNKNLKENKKIKEMVIKFNHLYGEKLNQLHNENKYYNFLEIFDITDQYISSIYDGKKTNEILLKYKIEPEYFLKISKEVHYIFIIYYLFGDEKEESFKLETSLLLRDIILKFANNIYNDNNIKTTLKNQKLFIANSHDSTIMGIQLFINSAYNLYENIYENVIDISYSGSLTFELYKDDDEKTIFDINNYYIDYSINDKLIKRFSFNNFTKVINNFAWNEEKINQFCNEENYVLRQKIIILKIIIFTLIIFILCFVYLLFKNKKRYNNKNNENDIILS